MDQENKMSTIKLEKTKKRLSKEERKIAYQKFEQSVGNYSTGKEVPVSEINQLLGKK
jgi:hypothetical protein